MKDEQVIDIHPTEQDKSHIYGIVERHHAKLYDPQKVKELGVIDRVSNLVCAIHCLDSVAYRMLGEVEELFEAAGSKNHIVKKHLADMHKAYEKFQSFFRGYQSPEAQKEMAREIDNLFHQMFRWCELPENWQYGDKQKTERPTQPMIIIDEGDREIRLSTEILKSQILEGPTEDYCVVRYETKTKDREAVGYGLSKADAQVIAKRASANEEGDAYHILAIVREQTEKRIEYIPVKAYRKGDTVGSYRKVFKK